MRKTVGPIDLRYSFMSYNSKGVPMGVAVVAFVKSGDAARARKNYHGKVIDGSGCFVTLRSFRDDLNYACYTISSLLLLISTTFLQSEQSDLNSSTIKTSYSSRRRLHPNHRRSRSKNRLLSAWVHRFKPPQPQKHLYLLVLQLP